MLFDDFDVSCLFMSEVRREEVSNDQMRSIFCT